MPSLAIIIPVYKTKISHLGESVISIASAAPRDSEIHIGFDGPYPEEGLEMLDKIRTDYKKGLIRTFNYEHRGITATLNSLIKSSDSEFVARHDSDDICMPERLRQQLQALKLSPMSSFCGTQILRCDQTLKPYKLQRRYPSSFRGQLIYASLLNNPIAHPSLMLKRKALEKHAYRDIASAEDWDLYIRLWRDGHHSFNLKQIGVRYRIHPDQITQDARNLYLLNELKARSLQAASKHYPSLTLIKPLQSIASISQLAELSIHAKKWYDR